MDSHMPSAIVVSMSKRFLPSEMTVRQLQHRLPGAIAYTWLGYAGRSAAAGDM
jgi:hypothetical protein